MMKEKADKHGTPKSHEVHDRRGRGEQAVPEPDPRQEIERLTREAKEVNDKYLRTLAEFDNAKKRLSREKEEFAKYASETVVRDLLPIVDSLDQALAAMDTRSEGDSVATGVRLIHRQLVDLLGREGVARIVTVGKRFDPHYHEAVAQVESTDGAEDETILEEVQVGYTMHGKVVRPAMVKIAKRTTSHTDTTTQHDTGGSNG